MSHDGEEALQSPSIPDNGETSFKVEVTGPGIFEFFYRCDSEEDYDFFTFTLDGAIEFEVTGLVEWTKHTVSVPAGLHTLKWEYQKDGSVSGGADSVWLDDVLWMPDSATGYELWRNLNFTPSEQADPEVGAMGSDPDEDGRSNLAEYAFGTSPFENGIANEPNYITPGELVVLSYVADLSKTDISYQIQESHDLEN